MSTVKEIQSVRNACRLVEAVAECQPIGVSELARRIGIDKSAAHRLAVTLHASNWLDRTDEGTWRVAPAMSTRLRGAAVSSLVDGVRPLLERARDSTGETAMLVMPEHHRLRIVAVAESRHNLRVTASEGVEMPARNSSALRALAASFDPGDLAAWRTVDRGLTDKALAEVRKRGWSVNDAELIPESRAVGVALNDPNGVPVAAFVVCGPSTRFTRARVSEYGELVASIAAEWHERSAGAAITTAASR